MFARPLGLFIAVIFDGVLASALPTNGRPSGVLANEGATESLVLVDELAAAVDLMQNGTLKLVTSPHNTSVGMTQLIHELKSLHMLARKVRGHYHADMEQLRAEVTRHQWLTSVAQDRADNMHREKVHLEFSLQQELQQVQRCVDAQALSQSCNESRRNDSEQIAHLEEDVLVLRKALNVTQGYCRANASRLEAESKHLAAAFASSKASNKELHAKITALSRYQSEVNQSLQEKVAQQELVDKRFKQQVTILTDKEETVEEQRDDDAEDLWEERKANEILRKDAIVQKQLLASLQREVDSASKDKEHLLDSLRALMHENSQLKLQLTGTSHTKARTLNASPVARPQSIPSKDFDEVAWMGRTDKIDGYMSSVSADQQQAFGERSADADQPVVAQVVHYSDVSAANSEGIRRAASQEDALGNAMKLDQRSGASRVTLLRSSRLARQPRNQSATHQEASAMQDLSDAEALLARAVS